MILENRHTLQKIEIIFGEAEDSLGHLVHFNFIFKLSYLNLFIGINFVNQTRTIQTL